MHVAAAAAAGADGLHHLSPPLLRSLFIQAPPRADHTLIAQKTNVV
jgi:hypothetical protein